MNEMKDIPGFHSVRPGQLLDLMLHKRNDDGSFTVETLYTPTDEEMEDLFRRYDLPVDYCLKIIKERNEGTTSVLFDYGKFYEHLQKIGYRL